jgi:hypothetical protein
LEVSGASAEAVVVQHGGIVTQGEAKTQKHLDRGSPKSSIDRLPNFHPTTRYPVFATTHWSVVLHAGQADSPQASEAMAQLCRTYWYPLYAYVRRKGHNAEEARDLTQEFIRLRKLPTNSPSGEISSLGVVLHHLADVLRQRKGLAEARPLAEEAAALYLRHLDWPANERQHAFAVLRGVLTDLGDLSGADALYRAQLESLRTRLEADDPGLADVILQLTGILLGEKKFTEAETLLREDLIHFRKLSANALSAEVSSLGVVLHHLAEVLRHRKALAEARPLAEEAAVMYQRHPDWPHNERQHALHVLAAVLRDLGDFTELEALYRGELAHVRKRCTNDPAHAVPELGVILHHLAEVLRERKALAEARSLAGEATALYQHHSDWPTKEREHAFLVLQDVLTDLERRDGAATR